MRSKADSKLRELRKAKGKSVGAVARETGLNLAIISDLERQGQPGVPRRYLARYASKLAKALGPEVFQLAKPGQLSLFDWHLAEERPELRKTASIFLRQVAREKRESVLEWVPLVFELPQGGFAIVPAFGG